MRATPMGGRYFITDEEGNMLEKGLKTDASVRAYFTNGAKMGGYLEGKIPKVVNVHDNKKGGEVVNQYFWGGKKGIVIDKFPSGQYGVIDPQYVKYKDELNEIGEGTSKPFPYKENFRNDHNFSYIIDGEVRNENGEKILQKVPIRLQGLGFPITVNQEDGEWEIDGYEDNEYGKFLNVNPGTTLKGMEVIFAHVEGNAFAEVNDRVFMFRLMATIKKILNEEFAKNGEPDVLIYSPTKQGDESADKTGRHRLYTAFIKKAFPNARTFHKEIDDEIVFKLK